MLARSGFESVSPGEIRDLIYLRAGGQKTAAEHRSAVGKDHNAAELAQKALDDLRRWVAEFDDQERSYPSQPRAQFTNVFGDYDHLARRGEWASAPGGDGGAEGNGE
jgi:ATP-dependent helicase/nuclease subunit B